MKFTATSPHCDRLHHATAEDVRVVLGRLDPEVCRRLRGVHFNDRSRGGRILGYVNRGHREIALCALPPRVSLTRFLVKGQTPEQFGAKRGRQWPRIAVRRFLLYDVFLHELGHLQIVDNEAKSVRRKFAMETRAQEFAMLWCQRLWSQPFDHPDPVHNPPTPTELTDVDPELTEQIRRTQRHSDDAEVFQRLGRMLVKRRRFADAKHAYDRSVEIASEDPWTHLYLGNWHYEQNLYDSAIECFTHAATLLPGRPVAFWCLAQTYERLGQIESANKFFMQAAEVDPTDKDARRRLREWQARLADIQSEGHSDDYQSSATNSELKV